MNNFFRKAAGTFTAAVLFITAVVFPVYADDSRQKLPENDAMTFVDSMGAGWNLGNCFDAANCTWVSDEMDYETAWCGAKVTKELISTVKNAGYRTIRVPVSWHDHVDKDFNISEPWLARVKEVVDMCLAEDLCVIINIHHDVLKGFYYPSSEEYKTSEKYMKAIWKQLCTAFADRGEKLIFEAVNEPRLVGTGFEWWYNSGDVPAEVKDSLDCINKLNQVFVDTVRASGGNNKTRYLLIEGYATGNTDLGILSPYFRMPTDTEKNRLIANAHYYGIGVRSSPDALDKLYEAFTAKGIPLVVTEYGLNTNGYKYSEHLDTAVARMSEFFSYARNRGISVIVWDNNASDLTSANNAFQFIDRKTAKVTYPTLVEAMVRGGTPALTASTAASEEKEKPGMTLSLTAKASASRVKLTWNAIDGAEKYALFQYKNGGYKCLSAKLTKTSAAVSKLQPGKTYSFCVRAFVNGKWTKVTEGCKVRVTTKTK